MSTFPLLSLTIFLPLAGAGAILALGNERRARAIALVATVLTFASSTQLLRGFDKNSAALQFVESADWIPAWNLSYGVGIDGISLPFILLAALLSVLCVAVSWVSIAERRREFYAALLVAETAMIGLFAASNLFGFFVFWEIILIPLFLLIGVWGGSGRVYAAVKFLIFSLTGSVLMLVGMIVLLNATGTLDFKELGLASAGIPAATQGWLFAAFLAAFAVKVPMFPLHTWLPDAHTEAPTAGSVILAGILLKMGAYGFLRVSIPILPEGVRMFAGPMLVVSAVAIVYGAYVTLMQTDMKRLIAYSSISHMGFVTLGIFTLAPNGVEGAVLQMINHGVISAALFLCVGMIYERTHTREIFDYGGVVKLAPIYSALLAFFCLAATGFPGLNSFVGEFLIVSAAFSTHVWLGAAAVWGVVLGTIYIVWLYYRVVMGAPNSGLAELELELSGREIAALAPLALLALCLGLYPELILSYLHAPVAELLALGGPR